MALPPLYYLYVFTRDPRIIANLKTSRRKFEILCMRDLLLERAQDLHGVILFAEGEDLLSAVRLGWPDTLGNLPYLHWKGSQSLKTKPIQPRRAKRAKGAECDNTLAPELPDLFHAHKGRFLEGPLEFCLKLIWPALGEQQEFNILLQRAIKNLEALLAKKDRESSRIVRNLIIERIQSPQRQANRLEVGYRLNNRLYPGRDRSTVDPQNTRP